MRAAFHTMGCKVNQYETEAMKEQFVRAGWEIAGEGETADVYVVNTCTVTQLADRKSRQYIRRARRLNPDAVVAVTGCYVQMNPEEAASLDGVEIVCGTDEKGAVLDQVQAYFRDHEPSVRVHPTRELTRYESQGEIQEMDGRARAFIKIQEGCGNFCSYCIIPYARGRIRSRAPEEVVREVRGLVDKGCREVVLTGINTAYYGRDLKTGGVGSLIRALNDLPGDFRIRLSSLEPTEIDAGAVKELLDYDRLCHHLHLALQSGSDRVLARMNRRYSMDDFRAIVDVLRSRDPLYGISTDLIVGFPGETEEDFQDSLRAVTASAFCKVHVFRYSPRAGTPAAGWKDQVPAELKKARSAELIQRAEEVSREFRRSCVGAVREVLTERTVADPISGEDQGIEGARTAGQPGPGGPAGRAGTVDPAGTAGQGDRQTFHTAGYTDNYIQTSLPGPLRGRTEILRVRLTGLTGEGMTGEAIE